MAKRKKSKRRYRMITLKVFEDTDSDILNWWEGIEEGERSDVLRDVIRGYLGQQPRRNKVLTIPELLEVRQDTLWIRDALNEMPNYLERLAQHIAGSTVMQAAVVGQQIPSASPEPALTDIDAERRAKRMRKATW